MSFWNGTFAKHRDHEHEGADGRHPDVLAHLLAQGASYGVAENSPVEVEVNPITMEPLDTTKTSYPVRLTIGEKTYVYFVPADKNGHFPNKEEIAAFINETNSTPLPEGVKRDPFDILDLDSLDVYASIVDDDNAWNDYQG